MRACLNPLHQLVTLDDKAEAIGILHLTENNIVVKNIVEEENNNLQQVAPDGVLDAVVDVLSRSGPVKAREIIEACRGLNGTDVVQTLVYSTPALITSMAICIYANPS